MLVPTAACVIFPVPFNFCFISQPSLSAFYKANRRVECVITKLSVAVDV